MTIWRIRPWPCGPLALASTHSTQLWAGPFRYFPVGEEGPHLAASEPTPARYQLVYGCPRASVVSLRAPAEAEPGGAWRGVAEPAPGNMSL